MQEGWGGRKRSVAIGGTAMAYIEIGGAEPPLVLIHGFTDTSRSFSLLVPYLEGRRLIIPDLRGHGASQAGTSRLGPADFADDLAALIARLQLVQPVLVGHSLGSMIAIKTVSRHPALAGGLVLLAGTLQPEIPDAHPMVVGVQSLRDPISPTDPFYAYWHACEADVPRDFLAMAAAEASTMPAPRWRAILEQVRRTDLTAAARSVKVDTLIVNGGRDPLFDSVHRQRLVEAFPTAAAVEAADCGHNPHWEDPALVAQLISAHFPAHREPRRMSQP